MLTPADRETIDRLHRLGVPVWLKISGTRGEFWRGRFLNWSTEPDALWIFFGTIEVPQYISAKIFEVTLEPPQ